MARRLQTPRSALLEEMQRRQNLVELEVHLRSFIPPTYINFAEALRALIR